MPYEQSEKSLPEGFVSLGENLSKKSDDVMPFFSESGDGGDKIYYPSLYFEGVKGLKDMPSEGVALMHYKKVMEKTESVKTDGETKKRYSVELCIYGIKPEEDLSEEPEDDDDEDAIESGLAEAEEDKDESEDEED